VHGLVVGYPLLQSRYQRDHQNGRRREQKAFKPLQDYLKLFLVHDTSAVSGGDPARFQANNAGGIENGDIA
jgi:hypothetical protein